MTRPHNILALALTIIVSPLALEGSVKAQGSDAPARVVVRSDDLDFTRPADAQILIERIKTAAVQVCGGTPDYRHARQAAAFDRCRKAAIRRAVQDAHQPMVSKIANIEAMPMPLAVR